MKLKCIQDARRKHHKSHHRGAARHDPECQAESGGHGSQVHPRAVPGERAPDQHHGARAGARARRHDHRREAGAAQQVK